MKTREEHLQWCKDQAFSFIGKDKLSKCLESLFHNFELHPGTKNHPKIGEIFRLMSPPTATHAPQLDTPEKMRRYINELS